MQPPAHHLFSKRLIVATLFAALGFFVLGYGAILLMPKDNSAALIWPATAFALCMILRQARGWAERGVMLGGVLVADIFNNALGGDTPVLVIGYTLVNIAELVVALWLAGNVRAVRPRNLRSTILVGAKVGLIPPLLGGLGAMLVTWIGGFYHGPMAGFHWFVADALGFFIVFPIGITLSWRQLDKLRLRERLPIALISGTLMVGITVAVFRFHYYPLQFLILPAALILTRWFRMLGAGAALVTVAIVVLTGPPPAFAIDPVTRIHYLQFFLAVLSLVSVRAAGLLNERDLHIALTERRHQRAVRASRFKTQLLSHVSHEVRSPLSAIIGFSSMLESGSLSAQRAPEFAAIIAHNGELLQRLHDDLLDLGRAEYGTLDIQSERVAVDTTLQACIDAIRLDATLGGKDVVVEPVEDSLMLLADPVRLAQILNNLIANAFKYGDNHSPIRVRASRLADGFGRIEIANAGPGIPADEREAVFLPFRRSGLVGRNVPGAGLGLSIAKLLVEAQGGRIDFESVPGRQTRFWIDLPLAA